MVIILFICTVCLLYLWCVFDVQTRVGFMLPLILFEYILIYNDDYIHLQTPSLVEII